MRALRLIVLVWATVGLVATSVFLAMWATGGGFPRSPIGMLVGWVFYAMVAVYAAHSEPVPKPGGIVRSGSPDGVN